MNTLTVIKSATGIGQILANVDGMTSGGLRVQIYQIT
jgi:hypothetical protein